MTKGSNKELNLRDVIAVLVRERRIVVGVLVAGFLLAMLACITTTKRYQASSLMELEKSSSDGLNLSSLMGGDQSVDNDPSSLNTDLQTQVTILQSDALALKVIEELDLEKNDDFKPHFSLIGWTLGLVSGGGGGAPDPAGASLEDSPNRRQQALAVFQHNLTARSIPGSRLLAVDFTNVNPKAAADVVNHLTQALIDYRFQTRSKASSQVAGWLEGQLGDLRQKNDQVQARLAAMQKRTGLFGIGGIGPEGKPVIYSPVLDRLTRSTTVLAQAHENRVLKEAVYQVTKTGDPELISQLTGTGPDTGAGGGSANSLALIQTLRGQEASLQQQISQDAVKFGASYPRLVEERASLGRVQNSIREETSRIAARAKNDYQVAVDAEHGARATYDADRIQAEKLNDKSIDFSILNRESIQNQTLYEDLLRRFKEAGLFEGLRSSNISVVDKARTPAKPSRPKKLLYLAFGTLGGLTCGVAAALIWNVVSDKVQKRADITANKIAILGTLPYRGGDATDDQERNSTLYRAAFEESIRTIRSALLGLHSVPDFKVVLITSGRAGEGSSALSASLADSLARLGKRVLLVHTDSREGAASWTPGPVGAPTLAALLTAPGTGAVTDPIYSARGLHVLPAGNWNDGASDLLGSESMGNLMQQWRVEYDHILLDCAPVLVTADAVVLAQFSDQMILVVRANHTTRPELSNAIEVLAPTRTPDASDRLLAVLVTDKPELFSNA